MEVLELSSETTPVTTNGTEPEKLDAFSRWYLDLEQRLPGNLSRVQVQGVGKNLRAQTTQQFWKLGEYIVYCEDRFGEEAYQYIDELGYDPEYMSKIRTAYVRCLGMKRKDLPIYAYRALSAKELGDGDRDLLAGRADELTREGFQELVKEHLVVVGAKTRQQDRVPTANDDSKKNTDEVDDLIAKGEALMSAMPQEQREEAIEAYLQSKTKLDDSDVFDQPDETVQEEAAVNAGFTNAVYLSDATWTMLEVELKHRMESSQGMDATLNMNSVGEAAMRRGLGVLKSDWNRKR